MGIRYILRKEKLSYSLVDLAHRRLCILDTQMNLREEYTGVLRGIFGPKRDEIVGGWRKSHNEDLCNLYSLPDIMIKSRRLI
jgi:hypothetical protein